MEVARQILTYVLLAVSVSMIVVVMMQKGADGGLGAAFGASEGSVTTAKGRAASKEAKLQKITKILAIVMGVLALAVVALP